MLYDNGRQLWAFQYFMFIWKTLVWHHLKRGNRPPTDRLRATMLIASSYNIDSSKWRWRLRGDHYRLKKQDQLKLAWLSDSLSLLSVFSLCVFLEMDDHTDWEHSWRVLADSTSRSMTRMLCYRLVSKEARVESNPLAVSSRCMDMGVLAFYEVNTVR